MEKLYRLIAKYFQLLIQICELHYSYFLVGEGVSINEDVTLIKFILISDNQYLNLGLVGMLNAVFNESAIKITRTNYENYKSCIYDSESDSLASFCNYILCEGVIFNHLKADLRLSHFKVIDISYSINDFYSQLFSSGYHHDSFIRAKISPAEHRLCEFFKMGYSDEKISQLLSITKTTISCHRRNLLKKFQFKNKQELYFLCKML
ncbi:TPA: helix-turn-helix transcriptional regulator [Enterobacter asburiae]